MDLGFTNVHVLVTGASGGIGACITRLLLLRYLYFALEHGARVTAQYHSKLGPLAEFVQKYPDSMNTLPADVTDEDSVRGLFAAAGKKWKQEVQVIILSHGLWFKDSDDLVDMVLSQWNRTMSVYLNGAFLVTREFLKYLRSPRQGFKPDMSKVSVVLIGSTCGEFGDEDHLDYACVSSALQVGFIRSLKHQIVKIAPAGRVNSVAPGWVNTESGKKIFEDKALRRRTLAATPLNRIAEPEDVAYQVLALASSTVSRQVTGTNVLIAGGIDGYVPPDPPDYKPKHKL
ncbi:NAD-dependent epimerase/dehydratase family protein [Rhizoctonia solani AG-3 Rhs1AP]|uniref:NAD-dependent epimerase/dehydratase family protein n=1 Tax=Rhizoctonia solani AG-3 Rhs1AP TaxID=1086054 RepID=X8J0K1_9AGAM|nr:NAD-dependent epimerase/dehydratase family protein [Rhizoctonia solani AG-3 Rhs1AP]